MARPVFHALDRLRSARPRHPARPARSLHSALAVLALPALLALSGSRVPGANRFILPQLTLPAGAKAQLLFVTCEHDVLVTAYSLSIRYDPKQLRVADVRAEGTNASEADFKSGTVRNGWISYGVLFDTTSPFNKYLEPASSHTILRIRSDVLAAAGSTIALRLEDQLETAPYGMNVLTGPDGRSVQPLGLVDGRISVTSSGAELAPIASAGGDLTVVEGGVAVLDGSGSTSPEGLPLTCSWAQVSGPPALDLSGGNTSRPTVKTPTVTEDAEMIFRLNVSDGTRSSTDDVTVTLIDLDRRRAEILPPSAEGIGLIEDGARAILWKGQLVWDSTEEDAYWRSVQFGAAGSGDEGRLLSGVSLYIDSDGDGNLGPGDALIGGPLPVGNRKPLLIEFGELIPEASAKTFFLVADVAGQTPPSEAGLLLLPALVALAACAFRLRHGRVRSIVAIACLVSLALVLPVGAISCSSSEAPTREVQFDLTGIGIQGATSGVFVPVSGLPVVGYPIEV